MGHQVYEIEALRLKALKVLRETTRPLCTGEVAKALGVPMWAATAALESAEQAQLAQFTPGSGWVMVEPDGQQRDAAGEQRDQAVLEAYGGVTQGG